MCQEGSLDPNSQQSVSQPSIADSRNEKYSETSFCNQNLSEHVCLSVSLSVCLSLAILYSVLLANFFVLIEATSSDE